MTTDLLKKKLTPMMEQWAECKKVAKDALLLFRMGDFYEAFYEDASIIAKDLSLTLTKRQGIPMSGVPWHASEGYIDKLVAKGHRVAIAEQVEDPKLAKGLVRRKVTRFITPGTLVASSLLSEKKNNYIVALDQVGTVFGIAVLDVTTGEFKVTEVEEIRELKSEIYRLHPSEMLITKKCSSKNEKLLAEFEKLPISHPAEWFFAHKNASRFLTHHFSVPHLDGFGIQGMVAAINAAGALLGYLQEELSTSISHIRKIFAYSTSQTLSIDWVSQRNLELTTPLHEGKSLLDILDRTQTAMGGRLLTQWLKQPLLSVEEVTLRQEAVEALTFKPYLLSKLRSHLKEVRDLERLMMRVSAGFASPRDLNALRLSLEQIRPLKELSAEVGSISKLSEALFLQEELISHLKKALVDEPPLRLTDGKIFREGFNTSLDELRQISRSGKQWIASYQNQLREETGIKTVRVGFNRVFGYYIEVSKGQAALMPESFQRRQTLANTERFISPALKEYESKVLTADERMESLEAELFHELRAHVAEHFEAISLTSSALANLDALSSLAEIARTNDYTRPLVDNSGKLEIIEGRHPIVERALSQESFIANDTILDGDKERFMLITGPNMAGKSTYIRQVALLVIMAQMGSFIPARKAHIGVVDKIFTRIGASDDLSRGQSTFMVEMSETANILNNATSSSLVILDEIGRGTSTYDGVAIAWAVAEYLLKEKEREAKTLFATHYFELTALEKRLPGAINYHASVQESHGKILFLHKIARGAADRSYGIHVARLAGLPLTVISRAKQILDELEKDGSRKAVKKRLLKAVEKQLTLFDHAC